MNSQDHDQPQSELPGDAAPDVAAAKPRRKRSPRVVDPQASEAAAEPVLQPVAPPLDEAIKPKRSRRKPVEAVAVEDMPAVVSAPVAVVPEAAGDNPESVKLVKPRRRVASPAGAADVIVEPSALSPAVPFTSATEIIGAAPAMSDAVAWAPASTLGAAPDLADGTEGVGGRDDVEGGEGPRRRSRNRRRGRRSGAERGLREDGASTDEASPRMAGADDDGDDGEPSVDETPRAAPLDSGETFAAVLSGDYDAEPADGAVVTDPERRVLAAEPDAPKLHKVLAQAGIGSRRDMEELIAEGQVMVNGQPAHTGQRISFGDRISVAGKLIKVRIAPPPPRVIAYHKPVGEVVTNDDPQNRPTVFRRLPRLSQGKWQSVGRLDINTEGLLLFTNSGELANQLMHPRFGVEREYAVRVLGTLEVEARNRLLDGVEIDGQRAGFKSIEDGGGEGVNHWYRVVITEGRNREVRKLFDKVGLGVSRLIRIRYGCVVLPRGLRRGLFVDLNEAEVREVRRLANVGRDQPGAGPRPPRQEGLPTPGVPPLREGQGLGHGNRRGGPPPQRADRDRPERATERSPEARAGRTQERRERQPDRDGDQENFAAIPNPLMQTFDKRAIREARQPRREISEDGPIPNPLEQTYDKRFVQKPRGFGGEGGGGRKSGGAPGGQPDPMKTSLGYIGADAFVRKFQGNGGGGGGGGGGGRRGGGGGSGGGGGGGGGGGRRGGGR